MRTGYEDVDALVERLLPGIGGVLGRRLLGAYMFGSVAHGAYDRGVSDVDILAVLASELAAGDLAELEAVHRELTAALPAWDDRVEVLYVSRAALRTFREKASPIAVISPGEPLNVKPAGAEWLMNWWDVREHGIVLFGPPVHEFIAPITGDEFVASIRGYAEE